MIRKLIAAAAMLIASAVVVPAALETATNTAPGAEAHSVCHVDRGTIGSQGAWARVQDTASNHCYSIVRVQMICSGPAGSITLSGPWKGLNVKSEASCANTGGAYPNRGSYWQQTQYIGH